MGDEGFCVLIDRLWPRGIKKEGAPFEVWMKEIAPSNELRKWYSHDAEKWVEFKARYFKELEAKTGLCVELLSGRGNKLTLVYSTREEKFNHAEALKEYLEINFKEIVKD